MEWANPCESEWQGSGLYRSAISYGKGVTISEAIVNVINDQTAVWAENRTPHEYLIPQGQVLGWLSEKEDVEDWIMGDYRPPDLTKGLISHDNSEDILAGRFSETHADDLSQEDETEVQSKESEETTSGLAGPM